MHWFDRLSREVAAAPEAQTTRRAVLKGFGVAAVATPFAPNAVAYASNRIKAHAASSACQSCLLQALDDYQARLKGCNQYFGLVQSASPYVGFAAAKKKKKRKAKPTTALGGLNCVTFARMQLIQEANACRTGSACVPPSPSPTTTATGSTTCPAGTGPCPTVGATSICCHGGDACCPCGATGGYICCAGVIGCTCC